jgi:hypothetical protein
MRRPFYFAWVDPEETTFGPEHHREDEKIISINLTHPEGDFAAVEIDVRNPRVGLLAPGRKRWAWLAWKRGTDDVVPLLFGRLLGIPQDIAKNIVRLIFLARPSDFEDQKIALAEGLKTLPHWDPVFIAESERNDPDRVLEARPALWHIDRLTHAVTTSSIVTGEDGTVTFGSDRILNNSLSVQYNTSPARKVVLDAQVSWNQAASGNIDITSKIRQAASAADSLQNNKIKSLTGDGLIRSWPVKGNGIGGGWEVGESTLTAPEMYAPMLTGKSVYEAITAIGSPSRTRVSSGPFYEFRYPPGFWEKTKAILVLPTWLMTPHMEVRYSAARSRTEIVRFELSADVQDMLTEPGEEEIVRISLGRGEVGEPQGLGASEDISPIEDVRRRAYFTTDRGKQSMGFLIALARTKLLARSRAVTVDCRIPFEDGVELSCRKNAVLQDPRLPGGQAAGKVVSYTLSFNGNTGEAYATVAIGCMVGRGDPITVEDGEPDYVDEEYVEDGYQTYTGQFVVPDAGDVAFEDYSNTEPIDDGINFLTLDADSAVLSVTMLGGFEDQGLALGVKTFQTSEDVIAAVNAQHSRFVLQMVPVTGGPFETTYSVNLTALSVPKTIDLEAT